MNRKQFYRNIEDLGFLLSNKSIPLILEALYLFSPVVEKMRDDPQDLLSETTKGQQKRQLISNQINQIILKEKSLKYRKIIVQSAKLEDGLQESKKIMESEHEYYADFLSEIEKKLEIFLTSYEVHTRAYSVSSCISLSMSASDLKTAILATNQVIASISNLSINGEQEENYHKLDLYLSNVTSLKDFSNKLDALSEIYTELLHLYNFTESDYPIVIEHLESGSLWLKIAGHTLTATLLTSVLTTATNYYQEQFTQSGKLSQLPTSVKIAADLLKISSQLESQGIDTTTIKDNIESATRKISKKLDILLSDQPVVEINEKKHSINDAISQKMLEQSKMHGIAHETKS